MAQQSEDAVEPSQHGEAGDSFHFVVGQDHSGLWVVAETHGLCGGIFSTKDAALRFAKSESGERRADLALTSEPLEFPDLRVARCGRRA
jgi:hypothetical protein